MDSEAASCRYLPSRSALIRLSTYTTWKAACSMAANDWSLEMSTPSQPTTLQCTLSSAADKTIDQYLDNAQKLTGRRSNWNPAAAEEGGCRWIGVFDTNEASFWNPLQIFPGFLAMHRQRLFRVRSKVASPWRATAVLLRFSFLLGDAVLARSSCGSSQSAPRMRIPSFLLLIWVLTRSTDRRLDRSGASVADTEVAGLWATSGAKVKNSSILRCERDGGWTADEV